MKRGREGHGPQSGPSRLPVGAKPLGGSGRGRLPVDRGSVPAGSDFILTAAGSRITVGQADVGGAPVTLALPSRPGIAVLSRWRRLRARSMTAPRPDASRWPDTDTSLPPSGHGRSPHTHRRSAGTVNGSEPAASARRCGSTVPVATRIAIPHRRASGRAGILLGHPDALPERRRHRMVQDPRSARSLAHNRPDAVDPRTAPGPMARNNPGGSGSLSIASSLRGSWVATKRSAPSTPSVQDKRGLRNSALRQRFSAPSRAGAMPEPPEPSIPGRHPPTPSPDPESGA